MSGLLELQSLAAARPSSDATDEQLAAWYERKAAYLTSIGHDAEALLARAHVRWLRTGDKYFTEEEFLAWLDTRSAA